MSATTVKVTAAIHIREVAMSSPRHDDPILGQKLVAQVHPPYCTCGKAAALRQMIVITLWF
jgi:hypothetical protein